jgi:isopentenyl-diphosphate delta-isomerase
MAEERIILVDERNRAVGFGEKTAVHRAGLLHRAFSIFLVDDQMRILLQRRSRAKYHSGGLWANSCCGHPRAGEQTLPAARRRLKEELGADAPLSFGFHSRYRAELDGGMQENEYVYVYFGPLRSALQPDPAEVADLEFVGIEALRRRILRRPGAYAYWLRHYFSNHYAAISRLAAQASRTARAAPASAPRGHLVPPARRSSRTSSVCP